MSVITIMFCVALTLKWAGIGVMAMQSYWVLIGALAAAHLIDFALGYALLCWTVWRHGGSEED